MCSAGCGHPKRKREKGACNEMAGRHSRIAALFMLIRLINWRPNGVSRISNKLIVRLVGRTDRCECAVVWCVPPPSTIGHRHRFILFQLHLKVRFYRLIAAAKHSSASTEWQIYHCRRRRRRLRQNRNRNIRMDAPPAIAVVVTPAIN